MKLPSISYLWINAKESFTRFPLTVISAFITVVIGIHLIENGDRINNMFPSINALLCLALGVPLYFCVAVLSEKMAFEKKMSIVFNSLATLILVAVYFTLPGFDSTHNTSLPYVKYGIYNITIHLFVSFVPFLMSSQLNGFWQYNKVLFIRFLTSMLYSGVLYIGLVLALGALKLLFDIEIHNELFFELFIVIGGFMNTWFFVSGIPKDFDGLDEIHEYPKGLKIFAQYILLPLLALYLVILYFYGGKILIMWNWPKGIVSYLIVYISVLGILTFLLLHPYGNLPNNSWIKKISKVYYVALIPLLVILYIAIFMRVGDYGITISRYAIILIGVWLTILCAYITLGGTNIKFVPSSLACMILFTSFGPWGMFTVSERSQVGRLKTILQTNKILQNNKIKNEVIWAKENQGALHGENENFNETLLTNSFHNEVWSILKYLDDHHGFISLRNWFSQDIDSLVTSLNTGKKSWERNNEAEIYMRAMGLKPYRISKWDNQGQSFVYEVQSEELIPISGYDYLKQIEKHDYDRDSVVVSFKLDSVMYTVSYSFRPGDDVYLNFKNKRTGFGFQTLMQEFQKKYSTSSKNNMSPLEMQLKTTEGQFEFVIHLRTVHLFKMNENLKIEFFIGDLLIKLIGQGLGTSATQSTTHARSKVHRTFAVLSTP